MILKFHVFTQISFFKYTFYLTFLVWVWLFQNQFVLIACNFYQKMRVDSTLGFQVHFIRSTLYFFFNLPRTGTTYFKKHCASKTHPKITPKIMRIPNAMILLLNLVILKISTGIS